MAAAGARVGAARSEQFPKFSRTGLLGRQALDLSALTLGASSVFSITPALRFPLFTGGRIRANIAAQEEQREQARLQYEFAVLGAFEDARSGLTAYSNEAERRARLDAAVREAGRAVELPRELYLRGLSDFLSVLESERAFYELEDRLADSDRALRIRLVSLYKALGGAWN